MLKKSAFPVIIDLEVKNEFDKWIVAQSYVANTQKSLNDKIVTIKSMYVLEDKEYRIILTLKSKVDEIIKGM